MIVNVWLVYKAGEPRVYAWSVEPDESQKAAFSANGFKIFRSEVELPVDEYTPVVPGVVKE